MNIRPQQESPQDVPEADALEQQIPVVPEGSGEYANPLPDDAAEADVMEQRADVLPGNDGYAGIAAAEADAAEADLIEQAVAPSADDDEDYPKANEEAD